MEGDEVGGPRAGEGGARAAGKAGAAVGARWGRPSRLGSGVRRHRRWKAAAATAVAAAAAERRSRQTLTFANLFAVWACCT